MAVMDGEVSLMRFIHGDLYMAGQFAIQDVRFHRQGKSRIWNVKPCWLGFVPNRTPQRVRIVDEKTPRGLRVRIEPTPTGPVDVEDVFEFIPDPDSGGWMIDHRCRLTFRQSVRAMGTGLMLMNNPKGEPTLYWEFDDPLPTNAVGPSVPMKEDWIGQYEPSVGPDTFRKHWRAGLDRYVFQDPSGKVRSIRFHRGLTSALLQYNRRAVQHKSGGFMALACTDGKGVLYEYLDKQPVCGHICEWGNDVHLWRPVPGDPERLMLRKGHVLEAHYRMREISQARMKQILAKASPIVPTREEWSRVETPVYEEPVNHFRTAWRDDPTGSAYPWIPGFGATWDRKVGRTKPGSLKLASQRALYNDHNGIRAAAWNSSPVGPSTWMNPLVPNARYRLSGYVLVREDKRRFNPAGVSLSITFHKYAGPGTFSPEIKPAEVFGGGVTEGGNAYARKWKPGKWYKIEAVSGPITGNVLSVTLGCHLWGDGEAWFDEIAFQKI